MAVRIGKIELTGLQKVHTEDARSLVQQRGPGQQGSVFQDLGREPVTLILEGILLGEDTQAGLEELRQAQQKAQPLPFAADVIAGADFTDVLIEDLRVRQIAGYANRFWFYIKIKEHTEPPEPPGMGLAAVNADIGALADDWGLGGAAALLGQLDPGTLMNVLQNVPSAIQHLAAGDIGAMLGDIGKMGDLGKLSEALSTITGLDPGLIQDIMEGAGDLIEAAQDVYNIVAGGAEFLDKLKEVVEKAKRVGETVAGYNPADAFKPLLDSVGGNG
jgi:hypothetical protein